LIGVVFVFGLLDVTYLVQNKVQINLDVVYILLHSTDAQNLPLHLYLSAASRPVKTGQHHTSQSPLIFPLMYPEKDQTLIFILLHSARQGWGQFHSINSNSCSNSLQFLLFNFFQFNYFQFSK